MSTRTPEQIWDMSEAEILIAIEDNRKLLSSLVGTLYPPMVRSENFLLRERYKSLTGKRCPL